MASRQNGGIVSWYDPYHPILIYAVPQLSYRGWSRQFGKGFCKGFLPFRAILSRGVGGEGKWSHIGLGSPGLKPGGGSRNIILFNSIHTCLQNAIVPSHLWILFYIRLILENCMPIGATLVFGYLRVYLKGINVHLFTSEHTTENGRFAGIFSHCHICRCFLGSHISAPAVNLAEKYPWLSFC